MAQQHEPAEFYAEPNPPELGDPTLDPPMTVRVQDWSQRLDPTARRVIRVARPHPWPWDQVTGATIRDLGLADHEVRDWPIAPPITYTAAFRHEITRQAQRAATPAPLAGDDLAGPDGRLFR